MLRDGAQVNAAPCMHCRAPGPEPDFFEVHQDREPGKSVEGRGDAEANVEADAEDGVEDGGGGSLQRPEARGGSH